MVRLVIENKGAQPDSQAGRKAVGEIVLAMRRDLLHKTYLDYAAFQDVDVVPDKIKT